LPEELKHFQLATGLTSKSLVKGRFTLKAESYDQLIDSPFELQSKPDLVLRQMQLHMNLWYQVSIRPMLNV
jgi:predicted metalloprotease with PDZ domain